VNVHLQTARLTIRRFTAEDEHNLVSLNNDPEVMRYITGGRPEPGRNKIRDEIIPFHLAFYDQHPGFGTWPLTTSARASSWAGFIFGRAEATAPSIWATGSPGRPGAAA
jgi:RimJ/RimL family protein N-acetyltransferase